ncbi:DUF3040 domain-containing protein [Streptomyces sp. XM83C]|jgi:hypothetical protein|uniref:DUF3040 domain-containing protein n=1 Tax=Streptomyces thermocoprophilus TaxID=78356 RepID=A0ABV5VBU8_9ACTN|nr:DUF3040 domain-containing protein [Streptomyces sp. XM83C]MCK1818988.1 DUF3040 domain-containing protein [Streptomyces sp. XM83C]
MAEPSDRRLGEIESRLHRDDPRFADALAAGRPRRPREYRRTGAWLLLAVALTALGAGITLAHGLLIATGLVLAGTAAELSDPHRGTRAHRGPADPHRGTRGHRGPPGP